MSTDPGTWVRAVSAAPGLTPIAQAVGRVLAAHPRGERAAPATATLVAAVAEPTRQGWVQRTASGRGVARVYRLTVAAGSVEASPT